MKNATKQILVLSTIMSLAAVLALGQGQNFPGGVPAGANSQVQFNSNGAFGSSAALAFTAGNPVTLTVGQAAVVTGQVTIVATGSTPSLAGSSTVVNQINATGGLSAANYVTATNCSSSASPAVCGSAASGSVAVAAAATTEVVNTTAVTANSQIQLTFDSSLGTKLAVTCNTTITQATVSARTGGTSFTITVAAAPATNPACFSYTIIN